MRLRVNRRGAIIGILFGISATLLGIVVIRYTELFILVILLWPVLIIMFVKLFRWIREKITRE